MLPIEKGDLCKDAPREINPMGVIFGGGQDDFGRGQITWIEIHRPAGMASAGSGRFQLDRPGLQLGRRQLRWRDLLVKKEELSKERFSEFRRIITTKIPREKRAPLTERPEGTDQRPGGVF